MIKMLRVRKNPSFHSDSGAEHFIRQEVSFASVVRSPNSSLSEAHVLVASFGIKII